MSMLKILSLELLGTNNKLVGGCDVHTYFRYFSGIYVYFSAIYLIIEDLLISRKNMIFAGNSCGHSVSSTTIIAASRQIYITGAPSSEVPGESYTWPKSRTHFTGKWEKVGPTKMKFYKVSPM